MTPCTASLALAILFLAATTSADSVGWSSFSTSPPPGPPSPLVAAGPEAVYYQEPQDVLSATLQLEGSTILPLTHATQQQAVVAVAQSVGEGVVADNVTVVAQGTSGGNTSTLACRISVPADLSSQALSSLQAAASNGTLAAALRAQGLQFTSVAASGLQLSLQALKSMSDPPNTVTRSSQGGRSVADAVPRWAVWALLAASVAVSIAVVGTYTWCFCCGCCCTGPTAPKGKTSQSDSSFLKPGEQLKRPHRHDSGVDIYANALFPPVTPEMMEGRLTMPRPRSPRASAIRFPGTAQGAAAPPRPQLIIKEVV